MYKYACLLNTDKPKLLYERVQILMLDKIRMPTIRDYFELSCAIKRSNMLFNKKKGEMMT